MNELHDSPNKRLRYILLLLLVIGMLTIPATMHAQSARISETVQTIKTYPFGDPSPSPILTTKPAIYPYFRFDGYTSKAQKKQWKVVTLENDYIKLSVLPQVGGKIWGAVEKSTGKDFIYKNDVLKFRDVGLRGPWTSGGIEFNFGYIGHTPTTATPVDYLLKNNEDGSVSCFIGALDLASRTRWRVEIRLPKDAATFQTRGFWYNATPLNQSYYYWSNAAIHAGNDLEFYFPGTNYIGHGGDAHPWPVDEKGRKISLYRNNDFGSSKSYHVLDKYKNYSGAYWNNSDFGYGRWAHYNEMPGKKIWIWALSKSGGIWEDLLTDNNGQYVEVQSGRLFSQANFNSGYSSPFNQYLFAPGTSDRWEEHWFPVKATGGIDDMAPYGSINVTKESDKLEIAVNAVQPIRDTLKVMVDNETIHTAIVKLQPMDVFKTEVKTASGQQQYTVRLGSKLEVSTASQGKRNLHRPLHLEQKYDPEMPQGEFEIGEEQFASRQYDKALQSYLKSLKMLPDQRRALSRIAEIHTRRGEYEQALAYAKRVLKNDTYDAEGNLIYGVINRKMGNLVQAKEAFGWAARSLKYRSLGLEKIAAIDIQQRNWDEAIYYAKKALNFNAFNMNAYSVLAIAYRKEYKKEQARKIIAKMLDIDPLSHMAYIEQYFLDPTAENKKSFTHLIRNELAYQTYLERAVDYSNLGLNKEAKTILKFAPSHPMVNYWLAYLNRSMQKESEYLTKAQAASPQQVFPFRIETIPVLKWSLKQNDHWKTKYYLGLLLWSKGQTEKALTLMKDCGNKPDFAPFYISRSYLLNGKSPDLAKKDAQRALELGPNEWRAYRRLSDWLTDRSKYDEAAAVSRKAYDKFPKNYYIGGQFASILFEQENYQKSLNILNNLQVLPSEGARRNHTIFVKDHLMFALKKARSHNYDSALEHLKASRTWPEHLGTGKPYKPDERVQDYIKARIYLEQGRSPKAEKLFRKVVAYSRENWNSLKARGFTAGNYVSYLVFEREGAANKANDLLTLFEQRLGKNKYRIYRVDKGLDFKSGDNIVVPQWLNGLRKMDFALN